MPTLTYPTGDFQPFTKILSADVNGKFNAITTLLNTTKLDSSNVQQFGLTRDRLAAGSVSQVVVNDSSGNMTSVAALPTSQGGTGLAYTPSIADAGKILQVDNTGTLLQFSTPAATPGINIFSYYKFT